MRTHLQALLLHLIANALLMALAYYWLGVGESRTLTLLWSAFLALVLLCGVAGTYGATLVYFQTGYLPNAWRKAISHAVPLAIVLALVVLLYALIEAIPNPGLQSASYLTLKSRKPVTPASMERFFEALRWIVEFTVLPVLLLPLFSALAAHGWVGFSKYEARARKWQYWIQTPVLLLCMILVPWKLFDAVVHGGFAMEAASFALRMGVAYLFFGAAWMALALKTSGGNPRDTKARSAASS